MNTIEVFETGKVVQVPGSWREMTPDQVRGVFRIFERCLRRGESPLDFNVRVLWMLLGVRRTVKGWFTDIFNGSSSVRDENVYRMCEKFLGFLFSEESAALTFDSVANPMPVVRSGLVRLYGPGELLQDLTFGEFRHASAAINRFLGATSRRIWMNASLSCTEDVAGRPTGQVGWCRMWTNGMHVGIFIERRG